MATPTAEETVLAFLRALEAKDHETVAALLAPDIRYTNVSLPTITGGEKVAKLMRRGLRDGNSFAVQIHHIAARADGNGDVVLTERTDLLRLGPVHMAFWVCGTFRVVEGRIVLWRDYFDWLDFTGGALRGLAGAVLPRWRPKLPAGRDD